MKRFIFFAYGILAYAIGMGSLLYAAGWLGGFGVPRTIDAQREGSLGAALVINLAVLAVFLVQHSVMARPAFKRWWTRFVPQPIERSTYVLFSGIAMGLLMWLWQPMGGTVWSVEGPIARGLVYAFYACGWLLLVAATFMINHFDLFGLRQVWLTLRGRDITPLQFKTPSLYKVVRHPIYVGWLTVMWAAPTMTGAHLVFALASTAYILIAVRFEERDLISEHGNSYAAYRRQVPMLIPFTARKSSAPLEAERAA